MIRPRSNVTLAAPRLVERAQLRRVRQFERGVERAGLVLRLRRGQRSRSAACRVGRQLCRSIEKGRRGSNSAARLRPVRRALQIGRDVLVGTRGRAGPMPGSAIRIGLRVGRFGQRAVRVAAVLLFGRAIGRGPHQRMTEPHASTQFDQSGRFRGGRRRRLDSQPIGRPPEQRHVAHRLSRREQQQAPRLVRQGLDAADEALLDLTRQRPRVGSPEPAGELEPDSALGAARAWPAGYRAPRPRSDRVRVRRAVPASPI